MTLHTLLLEQVDFSCLWKRFRRTRYWDHKVLRPLYWDHWTETTWDWDHTGLRPHVHDWDHTGLRQHWTETIGLRPHWTETIGLRPHWTETTGLRPHRTETKLDWDYWIETKQDWNRSLIKPLTWGNCLIASANEWWEISWCFSFVMITDKLCTIAFIANAIFLKTFFYLQALSQSSERDIVQWV